MNCEPVAKLSTYYPTRSKLFYDVDEPMKREMPNDSISYQEICYSDFILGKFLNTFWEKSENVFKSEYKFYTTPEKLEEFIKNVLHDLVVSQTHYSILFKNDKCHIEIRSIHRNSTNVQIFGEEQEVKRVKQLFKDNFEEVVSSIEWVYNQKGDRITLPVLTDNYPIKEFYPFLGEKTLEEYYNEYMKSRASILILIGPPGTGKTTFLRGLISHTRSNAIVSYDVKVLEDDDFFANFIGDDDSQLLILEDSDTFLTPRKEGNHLIMKFLNIGDGLVSSQNKKIIFTTNLPSAKEIDQALIRPGRCFDILNFENLTAQQANNVTEILKLEQVPFVKEVSLAEVFNRQPFSSQPKTKTTVGFI
jgi:DNA polymerase III delta prime subunit